MNFEMEQMIGKQKSQLKTKFAFVPIKTLAGWVWLKKYLAK